VFTTKSVDIEEHGLLPDRVIMDVHSKEDKVPIVLVICTVDSTGKVVPNICCFVNDKKLVRC
jgi:hypothetical protein